jgi:hypothetical protein
VPSTEQRLTSTTVLYQITRVLGTTHLWAGGTDTAGKEADWTPVAIYYNGTTWKAHNPPETGRCRLFVGPVGGQRGELAQRGRGLGQALALCPTPTPPGACRLLAPAGAAITTAVAITGRATLGRLRGRLRP